MAASRTSRARPSRRYGRRSRARSSTSSAPRRRPRASRSASSRRSPSRRSFRRSSAGQVARSFSPVSGFRKAAAPVSPQRTQRRPAAAGRCRTTAASRRGNRTPSGSRRSPRVRTPAHGESQCSAWSGPRPGGVVTMWRQRTRPERLAVVRHSTAQSSPLESPLPVRPMADSMKSNTSRPRGSSAAKCAREEAGKLPRLAARLTNVAHDLADGDDGATPGHVVVGQ